MGKVLRKLQSNNGATLMMALLFFVVCAVTGSMILLSASAAVGRIKDLKQRDQNYYAVRSAIKMYEKQMLALDKIDVTFTDILEITETDKEGASSSHDESCKYEAKYTAYEGLVSQNQILQWVNNATISNFKTKKDKSNSTDRSAFYLKWFKKVGSDSKPFTYKENITIPVSSYLSGTEGSDVLNVKMEMEINSLGVLTCRIYNQDSNRKDKYYMILLT